MIASMHRYLHLIIGWLCLALALVGAVLPLLPTTVFVLLAAFFFTKGSPRIRQWLLEHDQFGPAIRDWERSGAIAPRYKTIAVVMMAATFALSVAFGLATHVLVIQAVCMSCAAAYVLTRPNH